MKNVIKTLKEFNLERNWQEYHTPASLAKSISIEAAELLECFQWDNNYNLNAVKDELADVMIYCLSMANTLDLDIKDMILAKIEKNRLKYPR